MSDREAMLLAIQADPGDDTRRLVFADYLDEHGDGHRDAAWAWYVRWSCSPDLPTEAEMVQTREVYNLIHPIPDGSEATWERGFVRKLRMPAATLFAHAPAHAEQLAVVERVVLTDLRPSGTTARYFAWFHESTTPTGDPDNVPALIWPYLSKYARAHRWWVGLTVIAPDEKAAVDGLSLAAAAWCRSLIGGAT